MSAEEVTDNVVKALKSDGSEFIVVNFANPDMVGHTGKLDKAKEAVETVDKCVKRIFDTVKNVGATMALTADHGNAEKMIDSETDNPFTAHTTNKVPFVLINNDKDVKLAKDGKLADVAPTLLEVMGIKKPKEMTGNSLINADK